MKLRGVAARLSWTFADQAISSLTNVVTMMFVAHTADSRAFAAFSVLLTAWTFCVGVGRAVGADLYAIRPRGEQLEAQSTRVHGALGVSFLVGLVGALFVA